LLLIFICGEKSESEMRFELLFALKKSDLTYLVSNEKAIDELRVKEMPRERD
jgi:hypothetical protein